VVSATNASDRKNLILIKCIKINKRINILFNFILFRTYFCYYVLKFARRPAFHHGGQDSIPSQVMWDLLWAVWHLRGVSSGTSVTPVNSHYTTAALSLIILISTTFSVDTDSAVK
jgi:hypothetical protein